VTHLFIMIYKSKYSELVCRVLDSDGLAAERDDDDTNRYLEIIKIDPEKIELNEKSFLIYYGNKGAMNLKRSFRLEVSVDADDIAAGDSAIAWKHFEYTEKHPDKAAEMFTKLSDILLPIFQSN
jgi:hypothetical protein